MTPSAGRQISVEKNVSFFKENINSYGDSVGALDTYRNIRASVDQALCGIERLLDIGNGGTFDYDITPFRQIVAVDLFLEDLPADSWAPNVIWKNGSALELPEPDGSFDGVIMSMLLHHLIGRSVEESWNNISVAIAEAVRVLKKGGRLVIAESCVPPWFYGFERLIFPVATRLIGLFMEHPATLQFPAAAIAEVLRRESVEVRVDAIPKGKWILQYGKKFPTALTPAAPFLFVARI